MSYNEIIDGEVSTMADVPAISDDRIIEMAERAEKRIEAVRKIKTLSLRLTNKHDWTDQNGKPYLQASGGEKIARMFGISWTIDEPTKENLEGGHYMYSYKGTFTAFGTSIEAIGTRNSKDGFFKKYDYKKSKGKSERTELPASEIDPGDVKRAAYTNCIGNGVTRLLGIRNLTWEEIEQHSGVKRSDVSKIEYKTGGKASGPKETSTGNGDQEKATGPQFKKLYAMLKGKNFADEDIDTFKDFLKEKFNTSELTKKNMSIVFDLFPKICEQFLEWEKTPKQETGPEEPPPFEPEG